MSSDEDLKIAKHEEGLGKKCPSCGTFNRWAFKYCRSCGIKFWFPDPSWFHSSTKAK